MRSIFFSLALFVCAFALPAHATTQKDNLQTSLLSQTHGLKPELLDKALKAHDIAQQQGLLKQPNVLTVIDFSLPSHQKRLWTFNLSDRKLLYYEWVAHGKDSGDDMTVHFSNDMASIMSSVGAYVTDQTYIGKNGYSLRLRGLEKGFNDNIYPRAVVLHGAWYVNEQMIKLYGRLGRSYGCPAVRKEISKQLIDAVKNGSMIFAYYPLPDWLSHSQFLKS